MLTIKTMVHYTYPKSCPRATDVTVTVNGEDIFVYRTSVADFCVVSFVGEIQVAVHCDRPIANAVLRPLSYGLQAAVQDGIVGFSLTKPTKLHVDMEGRRPLFFYGNPLEEDAPDPGQPGVHFFKAGQIYEVGELQLKDDETVYIQGGAVVKGCIESFQAKNIRICGPGILDGSYYNDGPRRRMIRLRQSQNITIQDIVMIEPTVWMIMLWGCNGVQVSNVKQIGQVTSSDGVDVVGSKNVLIEDCFMRNNDDCIVIKAMRDQQVDQPNDDHMWDVENVLARRCVVINDQCGSAFEIGHELQTAAIKNIVFEDCDVLSVHGHGAVFSINNADRALITNVRYENIRVEHFFDKLIAFRILTSRWGVDKERGQVRDIILKDIFVNESIYNPGYSISIIGGYDKHHTIENIVLENIRFNGRKLTNADELDLYLKHATEIELR